MQNQFRALVIRRPTSTPQRPWRKAFNTQDQAERWLSLLPRRQVLITLVTKRNP
jgi:hypothetical protein